MAQSTQDMPEGGAAFAKLLTVKTPTIDDFKQLALLEASGQMFYNAMLDKAPNAAIKKLFAKNGQEEMGHAHRLKRVIKILYGAEFQIPENADNPFCNAPAPQMNVDKAALAAMAQGEIEGEAFYEGWANAVGNDEAAKLLRLNGKEEGRHGARLKEAMDQLP